MWDRIVIDACVLVRDRGIFTWLSSYRGTKILPVVAYIEYSIGQRRRGKNQGQIDHMVKKVAHLQIPQFNQLLADYTIDIVAKYIDFDDEANFRKNWRDCMIASHAYMPPTLLITDNVKDFLFLGDRVLTPEEIQKRYRGKM